MSDLSNRAMTLIGRAALRKARVAIPSKTLKRACSFVPGPGVNRFAVESRGKLTIPHYWAVIVHDGRKRVSMPPGRFLIWYKNPRNDPRFPGRSTPARLAARLSFRDLYSTKAEFKARIKKDRDKLIISRTSGPVAANPFFGNEPGQGMHGLMQESHVIVRELVAKEMAEFIGPMSASDQRFATATATL